MNDKKKLILFTSIYVVGMLLPLCILINKVPIYIVSTSSAIITAYLMAVKSKKYRKLGLLIAFFIGTVHTIVLFLWSDGERMIVLGMILSLIDVCNAYVLYRLISQKRKYGYNLYGITRRTFFKAVPVIFITSIFKEILYSIGRKGLVDFKFYNFLLPDLLGYVLVFSIAYIIFENKVKKIKITKEFYIFFIIIFLFNTQEVYFKNVFNMNRSHLEYISLFILILACILLKPEEFIPLIIEDFIVTMFMVSLFLEPLAGTLREYLASDLQLFYAIAMTTCFFLIVLKSENKRLIEEISVKNKILELEANENKEMLKKVTLLIDSIKNTAFIADEKGDIIYSNNAFKEIIGVNNIQENKRLKQIFIQLQKQDKKIIKEEIKIKNISIMQEIAKSKYEDTLFISGIGTDVTRLKNIQENLEKAKEIAEEADKAKTFLISRVSHEFKTPLNTITGMNYLLLETELDEKQKDYLKKIDKSAMFLLTMIENILSVSKFTNSQVVLQKNIINLDELIETVVLVQEDAISKKGLNFMYYVDDRIPKNFIGDDFRLKQIIINLISNAIKFTEKGYIKFTVKKVQSDDKRFYMNIIVEDTGIGISEEKREFIFKPFTQEDESITRKYGGTGIGLAICKSIIDAMEGEIFVSSVKGRGSKFNVIVPIEEVEEIELNIKNKKIEVKEDKVKEQQITLDKEFLLMKLSHIKTYIEIDLGETIDSIEELYEKSKGSEYEAKISKIRDVVSIFEIKEAIDEINKLENILVD